MTVASSWISVAKGCSWLPVVSLAPRMVLPSRAMISRVSWLGDRCPVLSWVWSQPVIAVSRVWASTERIARRRVW
jgi:hypothetical protein